MIGEKNKHNSEVMDEEFFDPRLLAAQALLKEPPVQKMSVIYPLLASMGMAGASLVFALSVILGPGWDNTAPKTGSIGPMVRNEAERITEHPMAQSQQRVQSLARASEFELSSNPDGIAISASEAEGLKTVKN
jgi:hypothetical protein